MAAFLGSGSDLTPQRLRGRSFRRLSRDLYVLTSDGDDLPTRVRALQLALPDAVAAGSTAAQLLNLPWPPSDTVTLVRPPGTTRSERAGVTTHRSAVPADEIIEVGDVKVLSPERVFLDLAPGATLESLVALGDVVANRETTLDIPTILARHPRRPGIALARSAASLLDPRSGSPAESRWRLRVHAAGFTALGHGVIVRDEGGGWLAEPDLGDPVACVAVQHDGIVHVKGGVRRRLKDISRDEVTRAAGWEVVISTALDEERPDRFLDRLAAAYLRSAERRGPGILPLHLR